MSENIARVRNCPDVTILISLFRLCLRSFCLFVILSCCLFVILSFCHFVFLSFCLFVFLSFCLFVILSFCLFVILSFCLDIVLIKCLKGLKCQKSLFESKFKRGSHPVTQLPRSGICRAATAAKNA